MTVLLLAAAAIVAAAANISLVFVVANLETAAGATSSVGAEVAAFA